MAHPARSKDSTPGTAAAEPADLFTAFTNSLVQAQRLQWEALVSWQQTLATFNKDVWEQWACHYGGGVPIDA
jgi:hypothetical protein